VPHDLPACEQRLRQPVTDEAAAAGDEDVDHGLSPL
jgi:hypothetical protein